MMLTRCPACATAFRVTPEQLKAKHGKVRCGQCQHIFNALDTLLDGVPEELAVQPEAVTVGISGYEEPGEAAVPAEEAPEALSAEPAASDVADAALEAEPKPPALPTLPALPTPLPPEKSVETDLLPEEPWLQEDNEPQRHGWLWALAAFLALLLLLLQAAVHFRVELAVVAPETRPALQTLCTLLGCDLPLPRNISLLGIDASDLHPDPRNQGQLVLTTTLKNRAPFTQTYPHLELTLTDTSDQAVLRKVLAPADYLSRGTDMSAGFVANSEIAVSLALVPESSINTAAAGYRLYLFYP